MADHDIQVHEVELLSVSNAEILEEPVVIITIRPDLPAFRPHNLSIARSQAERLLEDLKTLLSRSTVGLLLMALVVFSGCSTDVEVESETSSRPDVTTERSRTAVSVDLMRDQDGRAVEVPLGGTMVVEGCCIHFHEHLHIYLTEGDLDSERIAVEVVREWTNGGCGRDRR